jgi:hypothetical protein
MSHSKLSSYLNCPASFEFSYIKKIPTQSGVALIQGSSYHKGLEVGYKIKKSSCKMPEASVVLDAASDEWNKLIKSSDINWRWSKPGKSKDAIMITLEEYVKTMMPKYDPIEIEIRDSVDIDGISFSRVIDLKTINGIIDHKLAKDRYSTSAASIDLQSCAYSFPNGGKFWYHVGVKGKSEIQEIDFSKTKNDIDEWIKIVKACYIKIMAGDFPVNPTFKYCNEFFCPYWKLCLGEKA